MINLTIDGCKVSVPEGTTILEAARQVHIDIPTLCYYEDQEVKANCRICVVEVNGGAALQPACATQVAEGMEVKTATPRVIKARRTVLELIFARHPQDCLTCRKNDLCELNKVAQKLSSHHDSYFRYDVHHGEIDTSSPSIVRDPSKCILCGRCISVCSDIQSVHAIAKNNRGYFTEVTLPYGRKLADTPCVNCGQCYQVCPTGAITINDNIHKVYNAIEEGKDLVIQVAPSVRVNIAECLDEDPGVISTGRLVTALHRVGFDKVLDADFTADLTIMEEGTELLQRLKNGGTLPLMTSCCPAWVKFCETFFPDQLDHLSTCKSPQQMFGPLIKTWCAEKMGMDPANIYSVSAMPCTAKKFECLRSEMNASGYRDVDTSLTVQELAHMIRTAGIDFSQLDESEFDDPTGTGSGAGVIFGATGGVMEAALRTCYELVTGETLPRLELTEVRGSEGLKEAEIDMAGTKVRVAIVHGLANARKMMERIRAGEADYHFIEVMACPGGCVGGGGNAPRTWAKVRQRLEAIYEADRQLPIRKSHENPAIKKIYEEFLGEPCGEKSHHLLHTHYVDRSDLVR